MFNVGDRIRVNLQVAKDQYEGCKGTTVYDNMMKLAKETVFKVVEKDANNYVIEREKDNERLTSSRNEVNASFVRCDG
jgi:hypothetical protein